MTITNAIDVPASPPDATAARGPGRPRQLVFGLRTKLWALAVTSALAVAVVAAAGGLAMAEGRSAAEGVVNREIAALKGLGELQAAVGQLARAEMQIVVNFEVKSMVRASSGEWRASLQRSLKSAQGVDEVSKNQQLTEQLRLLQAELASYAEGVERFLVKVDQGAIMSVEAGNLQVAPYRKNFEQAQAALREASQTLASAASARQRALSDSSASALATLAVTSIAAVLVIAALARNTFTSIWAPLAIAGEAFSRIAGGDMATPVPVTRDDEMGRMLEALERMRAALCATLRDIERSVSHVADASSEIAAGNQHLSERTEMAAASLQEAVGSLVEVDEAAKHSATLGAHANEFARTASKTALDGQEAMTVLSASMARIEDGAKRIADITQIIDKIAFQTNVLALNASVEAAHGGERGRGFSVVAQEVRNLAQQCAKAAREIRSLIDETNERVHAGVAQADNARQAMQQASDAIGRVCELIRQIAESTDFQTASLSQITQTVGTLDGKVQQDAALVEECAAATERLREEAGSMRTLVNAFQLEEPGLRSLPDD